jgi:basic membrane protein A
MKNFKKIFAVVMALVLVVTCFAACGGKETPETQEKLKVGFIFLHDENSTYDKNFMDAAIAACKEMDVEYVQKTQIPESKDCYDAAVALIETDGCNIIFADSFGHESFLIEAAKKYPDVQFCHATGTQAHTAGVKNFHNAFASIYQGRYLAGVAAGLKLNEMIEAGKITADKAKMGYVGAFTFAEVMSGYTSFYLGAKSVCPTVTMDVKFTGSCMMKKQKKRQLRLLSLVVAYLSASTLTLWVLLQLVKQQVFLTFHTMAQQLQHVLTHLSFLQESTGHHISSI